MSDRIEAEILDVFGEEVGAAIDTPLVVIEGPKGDPGAPGKSAYELAVQEGFDGNLDAWLASIKGDKGDKGDTGATGAKGDTGATGPEGAKGAKGEKGDAGAPGIYIGADAPAGDAHPVWVDPNGDADAGELLPVPAADKSDDGKTMVVEGDTWALKKAASGGGTAPSIGDNGHWYIGDTDTGVAAKGDTGATGPAGPQGETGSQGEKGDKGDPGAPGAPGKDGAGMDITGATVGQIAKITAVDSDGKPTGWEPVDMPSGGGECSYDEDFELIMDDTVPENSQGYSNDKDVNGESFSLREWVLIVWTPAHTDDDHGSFGRSVGFIPASSWGHNMFGISNTIKKSEGTGRYDMLYIKVVNGYQMQLLHTRSQNVTSVFGTMMQDVAACAAPINFKTDATALFELTNAAGYATCVKIFGYSPEYVPAGTRIKLYGKRVKS